MTPAAYVHLDLDAAQAVGLLPPVPPDRLSRMQDSALCGCERLLGADGEAVFQDIRRPARHLNLAAAPNYEDLFIAHLRLTPMPP